MSKRGKRNRNSTAHMRGRLSSSSQERMQKGLIRFKSKTMKSKKHRRIDKALAREFKEYEKD